MAPPSDAPSRRTTARTLRRFLGASMLLVLFMTVAVSTAAFEGISTIADAIGKGDLITSKDLTAAPSGAPQTILIIGSDKRYLSKDTIDRGSPPHTDTIILLRLDPTAGAATVMSIPRDLLVPKFTGPPYTHTATGVVPTTYVNQKINYPYTVGSEYGSSRDAGDNLTLKVVKQALGGLEINDIIDLNFETFVQVVTKLGCVYTNVDHWFYNPPGIDNYATIDVKPGYQPLCGYKALDYVRYRHDDSTFARDARQQDFLRQAKNQLGVTGLLSHYQEVLNAIGKHISTNIHGPVAVGKLVSLALASLDGPVRTVVFPNNAVGVASIYGNQADQTASAASIRHLVARFLSTSPALSTLAQGVPAVTHHRHGHRTTTTGGLAAVTGLGATPSTTLTQALSLQTQVPFTVEVPSATYDWTSQSAGDNYYYAYRLKDLTGKAHWAYHITWQDTKAQLGSYYGIEGTDWTDPPLFRSADNRTVAGRHYLEVGNGKHIQDIGWIDHNVLYWVSNTVFDDLSNAQMVALAASSRAVH